MKSGPTLLVILGTICLIGSSTVAGGRKVPLELIGTWNYMSMTYLDNGTPFGAPMHYSPGQWKTTLREDGTWVMKLPNIDQTVTGHYEVHGYDLDMKFVDGKSYNKYRFSVEQDGKVLLLTTKTLTISASRE